MYEFSHQPHYRLFELKRDEALREAEQQRLAALANISQPETAPETPPVIHHTAKQQPHHHRPHFRLRRV